MQNPILLPAPHLGEVPSDHHSAPGHCPCVLWWIRSVWYGLGSLCLLQKWSTWKCWNRKMYCVGAYALNISNKSNSKSLSFLKEVLCYFYLTPHCACLQRLPGKKAADSWLVSCLSTENHSCSTASIMYLVTGVIWPKLISDQHMA